MNITDLALLTSSAWRTDLQPASFSDAFFHVDASTFDSGRRTVVHEFPKKNTPYTEDMGRRALEFTVRGYCICYPRDIDPENKGGSLLWQNDYRLARDALIEALTSGEPGILRLPNLKGREVNVICPRYRMTEEDRLGGYCVFDMTFQELGVAPREPAVDSRVDLIDAIDAAVDRIIEKVSTPPEFADA
jgi:prophage DNA circulation protein